MIVHPAEAVPAEPFDVVGERLARSFARRPDPRRLFGLLANGRDAYSDRTVPLLLLEPATGQLMQRLDLPARSPAAWVDLAPDRVTIVAGDAAYRLQ